MRSTFRGTLLGVAAVEAVPAALYLFLRYHTSLNLLVRESIDLGGDTDTIASMAASLGGAFLGEEAFPRSWLEKVESATLMRALADDLFEVATGQREPNGLSSLAEPMGTVAKGSGVDPV